MTVLKILLTIVDLLIAFAFCEASLSVSDNISSHIATFVTFVLLFNAIGVWV